MSEARTLLLVGAGAAVVLAAIGYVASRKIAAAIPPRAFDITSTDNLVYKGAEAVTESITGKPGGPGIALHRFFNPDYENWDPNAPAPRTPTWSTPPYVPPTSDPWRDISPFMVGA